MVKEHHIWFDLSHGKHSEKHSDWNAGKLQELWAATHVEAIIVNNACSEHFPAHLRFFGPVIVGK